MAPRAHRPNDLASIGDDDDPAHSTAFGDRGVGEARIGQVVAHYTCDPDGSQFAGVGFEEAEVSSLRGA